ncbi:hypothetical protein [Planktothrix sp.]|jgi:hypothetical protein|uniref:hypothetical protein n=1 Tax=Planktothrix sp. TaxID=3088171 RepID=UPI0034EE7D37
MDFNSGIERGLEGCLESFLDSYFLDRESVEDVGFKKEQAREVIKSFLRDIDWNQMFLASLGSSIISAMNNSKE